MHPIRSLRRTALAIGALAFASGAAVPAVVPPGLTVVRGEVRYAAREGRGDRLQVRARLVGSGLPACDPTADVVRISCGPLGLVQGGEETPGVRVRARGERWRLDARGVGGSRARATLSLDRASGDLSLSVRGFDGAALRAAGPDSVAIEFAAGGETYSQTVDFEEKGPRRWTYRHRPVPGAVPDPGGGGGPGPTGGITTLGAGDSSGITALRFEVVRDAAAWASLWQEHAGSGSPPPVDFSKGMVVGLWLGMRPTGGYSVSLWRMTAPYLVVTGGWCVPCPDCGVPCYAGDTTPGALVDARETKPGPNCVVTQAVTYPWCIVKVPRVEGPVLFTLDVTTRNCP